MKCPKCGTETYTSLGGDEICPRCLEGASPATRALIGKSKPIETSANEKPKEPEPVPSSTPNHVPFTTIKPERSAKEEITGKSDISDKIMDPMDSYSLTTKQVVSKNVIGTITFVVLGMLLGMLTFRLVYGAWPPFESKFEEWLASAPKAGLSMVTAVVVGIVGALVVRAFLNMIGYDLIYDLIYLIYGLIGLCIILFLNVVLAIAFPPWGIYSGTRGLLGPRWLPSLSSLAGCVLWLLMLVRLDAHSSILLLMGGFVVFSLFILRSVFLCMIGIHKWDYPDGEHKGSIFHNVRYCERCGKDQARVFQAGRGAFYKTRKK